MVIFACTLVGWGGGEMCCLLRRAWPFQEAVFTEDGFGYAFEGRFFYCEEAVEVDLVCKRFCLS